VGEVLGQVGGGREGHGNAPGSEGCLSGEGARWDWARGRARREWLHREYPLLNVP
jgi:hypothetical protein